MIARRVFLAGCAAVLLTAAGCERKESPAFVTLGEPPPRLQKYWEIPAFSLTERQGATVTRDDLKGRIWVADFFFTSCPGPCETLTGHLATVHREFAGDDRVRLVSITADPETDTPAELQKYATRFGANERWHFLTGARPAIHALAREGFKLPIAADPNAPGLITHSTRLVLIDRDGFVRGFYEAGAADDAPVKELLADLRTLLRD